MATAITTNLEIKQSDGLNVEVADSTHFELLGFRVLTQFRSSTGIGNGVAGTIHWYPVGSGGRSLFGMGWPIKWGQRSTQSSESV